MNELDRLADRARLTFHRTMLGAHPESASQRSKVVEDDPIAGKLTSKLPEWRQIHRYHKEGWREVVKMMIDSVQSTERAALRELETILGCQGPLLTAELRRLCVAVRPPVVGG